MKRPIRNDYINNKTKVQLIADLEMYIDHLESLGGKFYKLVSENITNVGGPMGNNRSSINYMKYFSDIEKAKKAAEEEYGNPINWKKTYNTFNSGDLSYVMYVIGEINVE